MPTPAPRVLVLVAVLLGAAGCADKGTIYKTLGLPGGSAVVTSAELRTTNQFKVGAGSRHGTVVPDYITCAEPSPDVAKAVSAALGAGGSLSVSGLPGGIDPKVAFSVSRAHAQSLAQLAERLATIQLLRDGLYRACEAYANGAISETTYAIILSRYDKMMITMLMGELAAGAFGRSLAALGGGAEGATSAALDTTDKEAKSREAEAQVTAAEKQHGEDSKEVVKAQRDLVAALKAQATAAARTTQVVAGGGLTAAPSTDLAKVLHEMQRKYLENLNYDALEVACVSALDRVPLAPAGPAQELTAFGRYCLTGILPALQLNKGQLLQSIVDRAAAEKERARRRLDLNDALKEAGDYAAEVEKLLKAVRPGGTATPAAPK